MTWIRTTCCVAERKPTRPPTYTIANEQGQKILGSFYTYELKAVDADADSKTLYPVKRVLRRRIDRATKETEVLAIMKAPEGNKYAEWIPERLISNGSIIPSR